MDITKVEDPIPQPDQKLLKTVEFVLSDAAQDLLLQSADYHNDQFRLAAFLRKHAAPENAAALSQLLFLRKKAEAKFSRAGRMFFTQTALEQASAEIVSQHRARRFAAAQIRHVADLCCSVGSDAIGLCRHCTVTGYDLDPVRLLYAQMNLQAYGLAESFSTIHADVTALDPEGTGADAFFIDPARRSGGGKRLFNPDDYLPPLSEIDRWRRFIPAGCAKLGPGIPRDAIDTGCEAEFISVNGEVREAALWYGSLGVPGVRRATILPSGDTLCGDNPDIGCGEISGYLYDPDGAVLRAGLVQCLGASLDARLIDSHISLLCAKKMQATPFAAVYKIISRVRFDLKELKKELRRLEAGTLTIIKKGCAADVPVLLKKLSSLCDKSRPPLTVFLTRCGDEHLAVVASRC